MGWTRTKAIQLFHTVDKGVIDHEKGGILFDVTDKQTFPKNKCRNFNLIFSDNIVFEVQSNFVYFYTAVNEYKYIFVKIKDLSTLPKLPISLLFNQEVESEVVAFENLTVYQVNNGQ